MKEKRRRTYWLGWRERGAMMITDCHIFSLSLLRFGSDGLGLIQSHVRERVMPSLIICESLERASAQEENQGRRRRRRRRKSHVEIHTSLRGVPPSLPDSFLFFHSRLFLFYSREPTNDECCCCCSSQPIEGLSFFGYSDEGRVIFLSISFFFRFTLWCCVCVALGAPRRRENL